MNKRASARAVMDPRLKEKAETILKKIGVTPTMAITTLYRIVVAENGWPKGMELTKIKKTSNKDD